MAETWTRNREECAPSDCFSTSPRLPSVTEPARSAWVVSDGAAGNERQALALSAALDLSPRVMRIDVDAPWRWLAPRLLIGARHAIHDRQGGAIDPPWPSIAIGCGRRAALLVRALRLWSARACLTVQILDPRIATSAFDVVVAPRHDRLRGDNVIETIGALNAIDAKRLTKAKSHSDPFAALPGPRTTVLVGASHPALQLDGAHVAGWLAALGKLHARDGGSFLVSTSRRTPAELVQHLREAFSAWPGVFWSPDENTANPYARMLAWADRIVVTPDSVNMLSEACATGKPVHTYAPQPLHGKLADFHAALRDGGHLLDLGDTNVRPRPMPLRETAAVAAKIRARWLTNDGQGISADTDTPPA